MRSLSCLHGAPPPCDYAEGAQAEQTREKVARAPDPAIRSPTVFIGITSIRQLGGGRVPSGWGLVEEEGSTIWALRLRTLRL